MATGPRSSKHPHAAAHQLYADPRLARAQASDKIAAARVWLLKEKPFFGVLSRALLVEPSLATTAFRLLADDRLLANPIVTLEVRFPALCARIAHLALHAALGALARRADREPLRWNAAHDLAIAPILRQAGLAVGPIAASIELPHGASADEYYATLPEGTQPDALWCDLADPPGSETPTVAGTFTRQDDGEGSEAGQGAGGASGAGAADAGGEPTEPTDPPETKDTDHADNEPPHSSRALDARSRELLWKMRLTTAMEEERASGGKTFGDVPAWLEELVSATVEPRPDWTVVLHRSVSMLTRAERSFLRPSRRMSALAGPDGPFPDVVAMPGRRVKPAGRLATAVDTSASMPLEVHARFFGELSAIATSEGFDEIRVVEFDAEVTLDETVHAAELLFRPMRIVGRGGTDFAPALLALAADARREAERYTVVVLTDLEGRFPPAADVAALEVLWAVPGRAARLPPFGKVMEMPLRRAGGASLV